MIIIRFIWIYIILPPHICWLSEVKCLIAPTHVHFVSKCAELNETILVIMALTFIGLSIILLEVSAMHRVGSAGNTANSVRPRKEKRLTYVLNDADDTKVKFLCICYITRESHALIFVVPDSKQLNLLVPNYKNVNHVINMWFQVCLFM